MSICEKDASFSDPRCDPELISVATVVRSAPSYGLALRAAIPACLMHNPNLQGAVP